MEPLAGHFFPALRDELAQRHGDGGDRDAFLLLAHAGAALKQMLPDDSDPAAFDQAAELLWQSWRFWDTGARLYVLSDAAAARLTAPDYAISGWRFAAPAAAYLQLPYQRLWARVSDAAAYEPVDGCFLAAREIAGGAHELRMLAVLGLRRERPGVSLIMHHATVDDSNVAERASHPWREGAPPFANAIPGGERKGYQTMATVNELEALAVRALHLLDAHSPALTRAEGGSAAGESALAHVLVP
jgi:hypothetical protein